MRQSPNISQLFYYGMPGLPLAMLGLPLYVYLPTFYSESLGLSLSVVGFALLFARGIDVITDPLIGYLNDKIENRFGRRKLFMLIGLPLLMVGIYFLLRPGTQVDGYYLFIWSFVTYFGWTVVFVPWQAWGAEITDDYHGKSNLAASREIFAVVGTILVISLPLVLSTQDDSRLTMELLSTSLLVLLPIGILPAILLLRERQLPRINSTRMSELKNILDAHPAVRLLLPAYFVNSLANALPATLFILFVSHVLQAPEQLGLALMTYFLSAIIGLPIWLQLAKKLDKSRTWAIALLISCCSFIFVPFLGTGDLNWFLLICFISGLALGADITLPASIQSDIAQHIHKQGNSQTGLLFGLWGLLTKLALALAVGLAFPILEWSGFNTANNTTASLLTLSLLYAMLPVILKLWVVWRIWNFPFSAVDFNNYWEINNNDSKQNDLPLITNRFSS